MPGPPPKPIHLRARTNSKPSRATLTAPDPLAELPDLPTMDADHTWHPLTVKAWGAAWQSPMASAWLESDRETLGRWAILLDKFHWSPSAPLAAELRRQEQRFGLSPLDRVRLEWTVATEPAAETRAVAAATPAAGSDPRLLLH